MHHGLMFMSTGVLAVGVALESAWYMWSDQGVRERVSHAALVHVLYPTPNIVFDTSVPISRSHGT